MKRFEKNIDDRKVLVARISQLTGVESRYTRMPRCAYEIGAFTVERDGSLTAAEGADESVLEVLISENMIGGCIGQTRPVSREAEQAATPAQTLQPEPGTGEQGGDDEPETGAFAQPASETAEDANAGETEEADPIPDAEYEQEDEEESAASLGIRDTDTAFPLDVQISFPLAEHTVSSLTNLICMIHTRGPLLSKATRGTFRVEKELMDGILDRHTYRTTDELIRFIQEWDGSEDAVKGISFDEEKVIFDGFTEVKDAEHLQTFMKLAAAMNRMAQTQKRVLAKETDDSNEKYALRVWLVRLGMNGSDYKAERRILMEHLSGHAAFRTKADEEKWKVRQQARKLALKAAKEEAAEAE